MKKNISGEVKYSYGQQQYDFDEGILYFLSPGLVLSLKADDDFKTTGWILLVHPDFLWNTLLAKTIKQYGYFDYSVNGALFVSENEEKTIVNIINNIEQKYHSNIDKFSNAIIISQLESLLNYSKRYYHRQFITRRIINHQIVERLEDLPAAYFNSADPTKKDCQLFNTLPHH